MQLKKKYGNCNKNIATWNQKTLHTDIFFDSFIGCSCALTSVLTSPILFSPSIAVAPPSWLSFIKRGFRRSGSVLKSCTTTGGASISHASAVWQPGAHLDASRETSAWKSRWDSRLAYEAALCVTTRMTRQAHTSSMDFCFHI